MQSRILLSALTAAGLWAASALAQQTQPGPVPPSRNSPPTDIPDNKSPRARPGGPVTAPAAVPPELEKLEAEAAVEIKAPDVPAGRAPEAKGVAVEAVKVRRATWVVEKLLPPRPDGVTALNLNSIKVGAHGWLDTSADVSRTAEGVTVIRLAGLTAEGVVVGVPAIAEAKTTKTIPLRGEYVIDRAVTIDGHEVLVLNEVAAAKALDDTVSRLIAAARARLEEAKAQYANAVAVLAATKKKAVDAALARTQAEAARRVPVPDNASGEERIKAKKDQDELAQKLAKPELDKIAEMYGDAPAVDPTRR